MGLQEKLKTIKKTEWTWTFQNTIIDTILENKTDTEMINDAKQIIDELNSFIDELDNVISDDEDG